MQTIHKRKKKLINKPMQMKMIAVFAALGCTCALFQVVLVNFGLLGLAKTLPDAGAGVLSKVRSMMALNILWAFCAMVPLMTCVGVVLTHRIAGPAYKMTNYCRDIAAGGPVSTCKIRSGDELKELCQALNEAVAYLSKNGTPSGTAQEESTEQWVLEDAPSLMKSQDSDAAAPTESASAGPEASA